MMEGDWIFYRESGQLWGTGQFKSNMKHGHWVRYDKSGELEADDMFEENKKLKVKK